MKKSLYTLALLLLLVATPALAQQIDNPSGGLFVDFSSKGGNSVNNVLILVVKMLLGFVGAVSLFFVILGGFQYMSAGMNEDLAKKAKNTLQRSILGLIIVILSYIIVVVVVSSLERISP